MLSGRELNNHQSLNKKGGLGTRHFMVFLIAFHVASPKGQLLDEVPCIGYNVFVEIIELLNSSYNSTLSQSLDINFATLFKIRQQECNSLHNL